MDKGERTNQAFLILPDAVARMAAVTPTIEVSLDNAKRLIRTNFFVEDPMIFKGKNVANGTPKDALIIFFEDSHKLSDIVDMLQQRMKINKFVLFGTRAGNNGSFYKLKLSESMEDTAKKLKTMSLKTIPLVFEENGKAFIVDFHEYDADIHEWGKRAEKIAEKLGVDQPKFEEINILSLTKNLK